MTASPALDPERPAAASTEPPMPSSRLSTLLALLCTLALVGCSTAKGPNLRKIAADINATRMGNSSVITPGDQLSIVFRQKPSYNQPELTVNTDGTVSLMELGTRSVAGLTPDKLADMIGEDLRSLGVGVPTVTITETAPRTVVVMGEVLEPGAIELGPDQRMTLTEAIGKAGSFRKNTAWLSNTLLVRWDPIDQEQRAWKIDARTKYWGGAEPVFLQPYDLVYVPNTNIDSVAIFIDNFVRRMLPLPFVPGV